MAYLFIHSSSVFLCLTEWKESLFITVLKPKWKKSILFTLNYLHGVLVCVFSFFVLHMVLDDNYSAFFFYHQFPLSYVSIICFYLYFLHLSISSLCLELVANYICNAGSFQSDCLDIILCNRDYRKNWLYCLFCIIDSSPFWN